MSQKAKNILPLLSEFKAKEFDLERLRTYEGFEDISEEEGKFVLEQLENFALILYRMVTNE